MGHLSHKTLTAHGAKALKGLDIDSSTVAPATCHGCELGKSTRKPFPGSTKITTEILDTVHSDLAGPMQTASIQKSSYFATFIDDYSRHAVVYYLKTKDQYEKALKQYLAWAETQTSKKLRILHSDRGGEYVNHKVKDILNQRGIEHHLTMPHSPQQNGKAKRFSRTIMEKAMAMLHQAGLSNGFWEYAVHTAVHIYNRTPSRGLQWRTPHETWDTSHVPDVSYFRVFGCKAYAHVPKDERKKLDAKSIETTFIGYEPGSKGYRLWDKRSRSVKLSRDVTFDESSFPSRADVEGIHPPAQITTNVLPFYPVQASNDAVPPARAASPHSDDSDAEDVEDLLDPKAEPQSVRPATPPPIARPPPTTPQTKSEPPNSPPPRQSAQRTEVLPLTPELRIPGGMENAL